MWARLAHELGRSFRYVSTEPDEFLIIDVPDPEDGYLQWHYEPGGGFYAEAASGFYSDVWRSPAQQECLRALGWAPPGEGWGAADVQNWSRHWTAPVNPYDVVLLTVRTLRDVFGADPAQILEAL